MKIIPPNFGYVEEQIFRCGSPEPRHYSFLASLNLKTCVLLTDSLDLAFIRWLQENNIMICWPIAPKQEQRAEGGFGAQTSADNFSTANNGGQPMRTTSFPIHDVSPKSDEIYAGGAVPANNFSQTNLSATQTTMIDAPDALGDAQRSVPNGSLSNGPNFSFNGRHPPPEENNNNSRSSNVARFLKENAVDTNRMANYSSPVTSLVPQRLNNEMGPVIYTTGTSNSHQSLMSLSEPVVVSILHILLDPIYYPLLISCSMGRYRSGIVCGCLRKIQNWSLVSILEEYRRFAGDKNRQENEEFIELFDKDLVSLDLPNGRTPTILYN